MSPTPPRPRRLVRGVLLVGALGLVALLAVAVASTGWLSNLGAVPDAQALAARARAAPFADGRFRNAEPPTNGDVGLGVLLEFFRGGPGRTPPGPLPMADPRPVWATPPAGLRVTWLGHSTLLLELDGARVLTDPVWGERASPSSLVGPRRFHAPPTPLSALPALDAVILSHDHYDHTDVPTLRALAAQTDVPFFVPLGMGALLEGWGVPRARITELDWWEEARVPGPTGLVLAATPARHFSGRGRGDNRTLWASWVVRTPATRVFFSGDTGLTPRFADIAQRHGPFDLVMLEVGAFHPAWSDIHLGPDQALEAHRLLGGGPLLPIHWGTFDLGLHAWDEPAERLAQGADTAGVQLLTPRLGAPLDVARPPPAEAWWRQVTREPEPGGRAAAR